MFRILVVLAGLLMLAGCTRTEQGAAAGGAIGAGAALLGKGDARTVAGATLLGAVAGGVIGANSGPRQCRYRDRRTGEVFIADC